MNTRIIAAAASCAAVTLLSACASNTRAPAASHLPVSPVSPALVNDAASGDRKEAPAPTFQGDITVPGVYRAYVVNGRMVFVRETDPRKIAAAPSSMRIMMGNPEAGEITYQPLLLEQEHAIELAKTREQNARNQQLYLAMLSKVSDLEKATATMRDNTVQLAKQVQSQAAYISDLEKKLAAAEAAAKAAATNKDGKPK